MSAGKKNRKKESRPKQMNTAMYLFPVICFLIFPLNRDRSLGADVREGMAFDAAPFGILIPDQDGRGYGIRWAEPRKIRRVEVEFADNLVPPPSSQLRLQYWRRIWKGKPDSVLSERSAGAVGWDRMDDWTNGRWVDAGTHLTQKENRWIFTFAPVSAKEIPDLQGAGVEYRKTLWIRLRSYESLPPLQSFLAYTDSVYQLLQARIQFGKPKSLAVRLSEKETGRAEIYNGRILSVRPLDKSSVQVGPDLKWSLPTTEVGGIEIDFLRAVDPLDPRYDRTIVTVRAEHRPFSFAADEIARGNRILVEDLGVLVTPGRDSIELPAYRAALRKEFAGRTIYERIKDSSEQTLSRAWKDMPLKRPLLFVHGLPGNRNTMRQTPNGQIEVTSVKRWFNLPRSSRDSDRKLWAGDRLRISFGFPEDRLRGGRELYEGYLPRLRTWWQEGPIYYEQSAILGVLEGDLNTIALDDPTVLLMRIRLVNVSKTERGTATLRFQTAGSREEMLRIKGDQAIAQTEQGPRFRFLIRADGHAVFTDDRKAAVYSMELQPGQSREFDCYIPSITLTEEKEIQTLRQFDFKAETKRLCAFWRELTARGTKIYTPEPWINDFYKAHLRHLLINCFREINSPYLHAHVGTFHYGVYPNESVMMISDLDRRGYHQEARRNLDAFLHYQGTVSMPGDFQTAQGQFYGAGGHETGGYNKSHGYVMWNMAQHWWLTRDREWMQQHAPKLIEACEWIIRERKATMKLQNGLKPLEYGWLPRGSLEDVTDYWYWLSTNSATVWGFLALADALADFGHPQGQRMQNQAKAFYQDFMRGVTESRILTPVVRLRDGSYVPKFPSRLYERGRSHGWLRETLEGALFLPAYQLLAPQALETEWILKDYEDNLYISNDYGYAIPAFEDFWFSRGGFSMQANLLDGPLPYLWRDDIKHFLRAYFNSFASAFYPEVRMCNEHSLPELGYPRGDHFKTSDEAQSTYWLRLMFINEQGNDLYLAQAIPRYWLADGKSVRIERAASRFGPLSWSIESFADRGKIKALVEPPRRHPPENIYLRIRHPQARPIRSVTLNGNPYSRFDVQKEWVVLPHDASERQELVLTY